MSNISSPASGLSVVLRDEPDRLIVAAKGEIDLFTISSFEPTVMKVISDLVSGCDHRLMTIDPTTVEFIDSCGLAVLLKACHSLRNTEHGFRVVLGRDSQPARVLRLGRFDTLMEMHYIDDPIGAVSLTSAPV